MLWCCLLFDLVGRLDIVRFDGRLFESSLLFLSRYLFQTYPARQFDSDLIFDLLAVFILA